MKLYYFIIGLLIATGFMIGTSIWIADLQTNSGIVVNTTYNQSYDQTNQLLLLANKTSNQFTTNPISTVSINPLQITQNPMLQLIFTSFNIPGTLVLQGVKDLGIPPWVGTLISVMIVFALVFAILAAIFFGRQI